MTQCDFNFSVGRKSASFDSHKAVRATDPDTSKEASRSLSKDKMTEIKSNVLHILSWGGLTDEELLRDYQSQFGKCAESTPRKRRCELVDDGKVRDSGERRKLSTGRNGIVWEIVK